MFNQFSHFPTFIAVIAAITIYGTSNAEHLPQVFFVHHPLPASETIANDATSSSSSEKYVVAVQSPEPPEEAVATSSIASSSEPRVLHGAADESSSSTSSTESQSIRRRLWDAINNDNLDPDDVDANELLHSSSSSSSVAQAQSSSTSSAQSQSNNDDGGQQSSTGPSESFAYTAYVKIYDDDIASILDNLEAATGNGPDRIDGFLIMTRYEPTDDSATRNQKLADMQTQINRARSMGYSAIPGLDWEPGKEIPDSASSTNWKRYLTWGEESTYTTRINQYLNSLLGMRASGDHRIAIDYAAEDLMYIDGSNPPSIYPNRNGEANDTLDAMYPTMRVWVQSNNVDLLLVPGGMHYILAHLLSHWADIVSIDPATLEMPNAYTSNPSQYASLTETLSLLQRAQSILQVPYQPMFSAEVLRDRSAGFRTALPNLSVSTFVVEPTDADGNASDLFSSSWFSQQ